MKFFFPDSQDYVDPTFDFVLETRSRTRVRQRDDLYAHEVLKPPPYDGLLVSKSIVDGSVSGPGKYTVAQRQRFYRRGVREFLRLDTVQTQHLQAMGDCGAFAYASEPEPPYSVEEVLSFYQDGKFDLGISPDHVILAFDASVDSGSAIDPDWVKRREITIARAAEFLKLHRARRCTFVPLGAAQGWSPKSYATSVRELQALGYDYIAVGGLVPLKTPEIVATLEAINEVRKPRTGLHLLGVTRPDSFEVFQSHGVVSFDSTAPLQRAFKDAKVNYYADPEPFTAIHVPQVDGNPTLCRAIRAGRVCEKQAVRLEGDCLKALRDYGRKKTPLSAALDALMAYAELHTSASKRPVYERTLRERPWTKCECQVCQELGIDVVLFRGAERNRRRGFHNLYVFRKRMQSLLTEAR